MPRYKLSIEYEGTRYSGWQVQKNARTVQGELIGAAKTVFGHDRFELMGAGRTDAGVHALHQVAHLDVDRKVAPIQLQRQINDLLPADINILRVENTSATFHARHDAVARSYVYQIATRRSAFAKRFVWWIKDSLDLHAMQRAAVLFEGMQDFRSFTRDEPSQKSTKVLMEEVRMEKVGEMILIRLTASHFLWNMVRQVVGSLVEVGRRNMDSRDIERLLKTESDETRRYTASPSGLFLEHIYYKGDERQRNLSPTITLL